MEPLNARINTWIEDGKQHFGVDMIASQFIADGRHSCDSDDHDTVVQEILDMVHPLT